MKKLLSLMLCLMMIVSGSALADTISVSGNASVSAMPDTVVIRLGAEVERKTVAEAQQELNTILNSILAAFAADEELALAEDAIHTEDYDISPRYEYRPITGDRFLSGYAARSILKITTDQLDQVGRIIDVAFSNGANEMEGLSFELEDSSAVSDQALEMALADAMHKAELISKTVGIPLEEMKKHVEITSSYGSYVTNKMYMADMEASESSTTILGGPLSFSAHVNIIYTDE